MTTSGFKTITVPDKIYEKYTEIYKKNKIILNSKGINSLSGYFTSQMAQIINEDKVFSKFTKKIQLQSIDDDRIILLDTVINRVVEVQFQKSFDSLICLVCNSHKCYHIGFCYSIHKIYERLSK